MTSQERTLVRPMLRKPLDDEIDVCGLTHVGKKRSVNEDHFLICSLHKSIAIHGSSLPDFSPLPAGSDRVAFLAMVADGVGGSTMGRSSNASSVSRPGKRPRASANPAAVPSASAISVAVPATFSERGVWPFAGTVPYLRRHILSDPPVKVRAGGHA